MTRRHRWTTTLAAVAVIGSGLLAGCTDTRDDAAACKAAAATFDEAEPARDHDDRVDAMNGPGWVAGDSTYSVALPDGRTLWLYSDSFIGSLTRKGEPQPGTTMVHNALVVESPDGTSQTLTGTKDGKSSAFFPDVDDQAYYWVQDASVQGKELVVFLSRTEGSGMSFRWTGTAVARVALPALTIIDIQPAATVKKIAWGAAIMETDEATFVYGIEDLEADKHLHLAKVPPGALTDRSQWEYHSADGWTKDPQQSQRITDGVANELSVQPYDDGFLMVTSDTREPFSPEVVAYTACAPTGPWGEPSVLYTTPETGEGEHFTYNAHAHPGLPGVPEGELLISYNVNTFDGDELFATPSIYRPRFITVPLP